MFPTHTSLLLLPHTFGLYTRVYASLGLEDILMTIIEGLHAHLTIVELPFRSLLVLWVSHIERAFPYLWLSHGLELSLKTKTIWRPTNL